MKSLEDVMNTLPEGRRAKIQARADELIAKKKTPRNRRKARDLTQERMGGSKHRD